jgi:hypothetical protein
MLEGGEDGLFKLDQNPFNIKKFLYDIEKVIKNQISRPNLKIKVSRDKRIPEEIIGD